MSTGLNDGPMPWRRPSGPVRELIRLCARIVLNPRPEWLAELDAAVAAAAPPIASDPQLAAVVKLSFQANAFFWATANVRDPGAPVAPNTGPEPMVMAREMVRRGLDAVSLDAYRVTEAVAWRMLMEVAFSVTSDAGELRELLHVCSMSVTAFSNATLALIAAQIDAERDELVSGAQAQRRETVQLLLQDGPISRTRAETSLRYALNGTHTAAIVWSDDVYAPGSVLDRAEETFRSWARGGPALTVTAGSSTRWVWVPRALADGGDTLTTLMTGMPAIRVAIGPAAEGIEGFRRSHFGAATAQQMMARLGSVQQVAFYEDVRLVAMVTTDLDSATAFVNDTLGDFASSSRDLHDVVRVFIEEQHNASRTAARLYTHRSTLLRKLARADELLPRPLAERAVDVAVALDVLRWRAAPASGRDRRRARS